MGTKERPDAFDCHKKAKQNEPLFTLLARDPLAAQIVRIWAATAEKDANALVSACNALQRIALKIPSQPTSKIYNAYACADSMDAWRKRNVK
jgi:hypothetical protein